MKEFLKKKNVHISFEAYFIDAMGMMAMGLFSTLIVGVMLDTLGNVLNMPFLVDPLASSAKAMSGPGIAIAVAIGLKAPNLVIFASTITGWVGYQLGGPIGAYIAAVIGAEFGKLVSGETSIDVVLTPLTTIATGATVGYFVGPPIDSAMQGIGAMINEATNLQPLLMGLVIGAAMGLLLVLPTSSTAIVVMINLTGAASGATAAGCCAVCVAFGIMSFEENGWKGIWAQIPGSPMIQVANIMRNPKVLVPPTIICAICGALATTLIPIICTPSASGSGTSGLVTPIGVLTGMIGTEPLFLIIIKIILLLFVIPGVLAYFFNKAFRNIGWIKSGDLKLAL